MSDEGSEPRSDEGDARLVRAVLAGRDIVCPRCGYNLKDLPNAACPECGGTIVLSVDADAGPVRGAAGMYPFLVLALIALAIVNLANGWLEGSLLVDYSLVVQGLSHWPLEYWALFVTSATSFLICAVGLIMIMRRRKPSSRRRAWSIGLGSTLILMQVAHTLALFSYLWNG